MGSHFFQSAGIIRGSVKLVLFSIPGGVRCAARGIKVALVPLAMAAANTTDRERNKKSSTNPKDLLALPEFNSEPYRGTD